MGVPELVQGKLCAESRCREGGRPTKPVDCGMVAAQCRWARCGVRPGGSIREELAGVGGSAGPSVTYVIRSDSRTASVGIGAGSRNRTHDQRFTKAFEDLVTSLHHQL